MSTLALGVWASASYPHVPCECPAPTGLWLTSTWVSSALRHPIARSSTLSEAKPSAFTLNPTHTPAHPPFPQPHSISMKLTQGTSPIFHSKGNIKAHIPSDCLLLFLPPSAGTKLSSWAGASSSFHHFLPHTAWSVSIKVINNLHIPTSCGHCPLVAFCFSVTAQEITLNLGKAMPPGLL